MKKTYKIPVVWSKKVYEVAVSWTETGIVLIKGNNLETAIEKVEKTIDNIPLPEGEYLDDSFQIDKNTTKILHEITHSKKN